MYSIERAGVTKTAIEQAEENYRTTLEKYNVQLAPSSELVDAETSLLQAKTNYINALIDYQLSKIKLNKSLGRAIY
jgi:outer membrane protein TolC